MVQVPAEAAVAAAAERLQQIQEAENGGKQTPLQKKYFSADMMSRYEAMAESITKVEAQGEEVGAMKDLEEHWDRFMDFSWASQWDGKKFDVIFYGASGYQGHLMMQYLKRYALSPERQQFTFALAGRSATKVAEMRDREFQNTPWEDTPVLSASYDDVVSIIDLVKSAHVIVNVAGPYMLAEGEVLVDACIWCKAHYVDVSMEVPWNLRVKELHRYAMDAEVMVVPSCCSSAYPDLGVFMLAKKLKDTVGQATRSAVCYCEGGGQPGVSGGMLKTRAAMSNAARGGSEVNALLDPFSLGGFIPQVDRNGVKEVDIQSGTGLVTPKPRCEDQDHQMNQISQDEKLGIWRYPYANAFFDSRLVRRSNMLQADLANEPYGLAFNFTEFAMLPSDKAEQIFKKDGEVLRPFGQYGITLEEELKMTNQGKGFRAGEGPLVEDMSNTWTGYFLHAESVDGHQDKCSFIASDGYFESARIAVETALTLRFDRARLQFRGGVLTPSAAGGTCLVERLIHTGVKFKMGGVDGMDSAQGAQRPRNGSVCAREIYACPMPLQEFMAEEFWQISSGLRRNGFSEVRHSWLPDTAGTAGPVADGCSLLRTCMEVLHAYEDRGRRLQQALLGERTEERQKHDGRINNLLRENAKLQEELRAARMTRMDEKHGSRGSCGSLARKSKAQASQAQELTLRTQKAEALARQRERELEKLKDRLQQMAASPKRKEPEQLSQARRKQVGDDLEVEASSLRKQARYC
ncbi:unnamed protein product [Effrenium voratum]|nr:unnamed protein product [Effrenium voratum]